VGGGRFRRLGAFLTMGEDIWYRPSRVEAEYLAFVMRNEPEPRPHACGRCRNPYTGGREDCPNNRR
jgi:hypothetical protein